MKEPFIKAQPILKKLKTEGYEAYFVGGSVRDFLLERPIGDVDIATSARPEEVLQLFERTIPVGIQHGTVIVIHQNESYEITTFRIDGDYKDFRHPSHVEFVSSLELDLSRRDFTINAIAMDEDGVIIDPFKGISDLKGKYIQTVGNPDERFFEDPLRMMRAIRFVSQLDFVLSEKTKESIRNNIHLLKKISIERIAIEFEKLLIGKANKKALMLIVELGVHPYLPGLANKEKKIIQFAEKCHQQQLTITEQWTLLLSILNVNEVEQFFKKWKSSNERIKKCKLSITAIGELGKIKAFTLMFVYTYPFEVLKSALKVYCLLESKDFETLLKQLESIENKLPITERRQLAVTGHDVMDWFDKKGGPWLATTIEMIESAVVNGEISNDKEEIKEWLFKCNPQFENNY